MSPVATVAAQSSGTLRVALLVVIAAVLLAPLAVRTAQRAFDPFEPIVLFAVVYGAMFVIRPSVMLIRGDLVYEGPRTTLDITATYTQMLVVGLVGAIGFVAGYFSPAARSLARRAPLFEGPRDVRLAGLVAFLLGSAGIAVFTIALVSTRGLDGISLFLQGRSPELRDALAASSFYPWAAAFVVVPSTIVVAAVAWARASWRFTLLALVLAAAVLLRALPTGNRLLLLPFLGALFVLYFLRRGTRPGLRLVITIAVVALIGSAVLSDLRGRGDRDESALTSVRNVLIHPTRVVSPFTTGPDTEMPATLAAALQIIPAEQSHSLGATIFGDLVTRPIPRPLWAGKPQTPRHQMIATIWPVEATRGVLNPEFSALLYFYWDFSYVGVFAGLTLYGLLAGALFRYYALHSSHFPVQVFFALGLWFLPIALRDSPVDTLMNLTVGLAPILLVFWLAGVIERRVIRSRGLVTSAG